MISPLKHMLNLFRNEIPEGSPADIMRKMAGNNSITLLSVSMIIIAAASLSAENIPGVPGGDSKLPAGFAVVATVKERDAIKEPADGHMVLLQASGNLHRWDGAKKAWEILNGSVVNVKDLGARGDGVDDTEAIVKAFKYARSRGSSYFSPMKIFFPPGEYRIARTLLSTDDDAINALSGTSLEGDGAIIIGPGIDKAIFDVGNYPVLSARISGLVFRNFKNVVKCWVAKGNCSWVGNVTFDHCGFSGGDYVMVNNATPNMYVIFNDVIVDQCHLYKGMSDSVLIQNLKGMTKGTSDGTEKGKPWSGGWCESGGEEDGIKCVGSGASFHASNIMCSPIGVNYDPAADQSWFKMTEPGKVLLTACRWGGEYGGIPLVKNLKPGSMVVISGGDHYTAWRPRYIFEAFPQTFCESGLGGLTGGGIFGGGAEGLKNGFKMNPLRPSAQNDANFLIYEDLARQKGAEVLGFVNYNPMPFNPVNKTSSGDANEVFHEYGCTVNVKPENADAGFEGLKGKRYMIADAGKFMKNEMTGLCAQLHFETVPDHLYNLTFFYRSRQIKFLRLDCLMPGAPPADPSAWQETSNIASLADTRGALAQATVSFYVEKAGIHSIYMNVHFNDPTGYIEVYPISISDGPFGAAYLNGPRPTANAKASQEPPVQRFYSQRQTTLHFMGDSAPMEGRWRKGSLVYNNNPAPGVPVGWICTEAGEPGVWCPFGQIGNPQPAPAK